MWRMFRTRLTDDAELRTLEPWQADEFFAHIERAREHIAPWVPIPHQVRDLTSARAWLQRYADMQARDAGRVYGIWLRGVGAAEPDTLVGGTVFPHFDAVSGDCEIGVWLEPAGERRGLITAACVLMVEWAVHQRGMARIEWRTNPHNVRSKAVAQRLGMKYEGTLRSTFSIGGRREDTEIWSVLATEWAK